MLHLHIQSLVLIFAVIASAAPLWPIPSHYSLGTEVVWMSRNLQFHYSILNSVSALQWNGALRTIVLIDVLLVGQD